MLLLKENITMNTNIRKILAFNHKKGVIEFKSNTANDYLILHNPENLRHIGKVLRYYAMKHFFWCQSSQIFWYYIHNC